MTCIVGLLDDDCVYLGGDTYGSDGHVGYNINRPKVFKVDNFIIGGTTSFRMLDLLEFSLHPVLPYSDENMDKYMRTTFITSVKSCLRDGGFLVKKDNADFGGNFLVAYKSKLWEIQSDFSVLNRKPFACVGAGTEVAIGSLLTTENLQMCPITRVEKALESASQYCVGVKGPFTIFDTNNVDKL